MEPELYIAPPPPKPQGHWIGRGLKAVLLEHRVPHVLEGVTDKLCDRLGLHHKTVTVEGCKIKMQRLGTGPVFVNSIILNKEYNPPGYEIRETDTVIDIGGNIGVFAVLAARCAKQGRVFTFEPVRENYGLLEKNIALNGLANVVAQNVAILSERKKVKIYLNANNTGSHSIHVHRGSDPGWFEEIEAIPLSEIFEQCGINRCNFLKLDCEGAEFDILYGLPRQYFDRIDRIAMEYHCSSFQAKRAEGQKLVDFLQHVGFRCDRYTEFVKFCGGHIFARRTEVAT